MVSSGPARNITKAQAAHVWATLLLAARGKLRAWPDLWGRSPPNLRVPPLQEYRFSAGFKATHLSIATFAFQNGIVWVERDINHVPRALPPLSIRRNGAWSGTAGPATAQWCLWQKST